MAAEDYFDPSYDDWEPPAGQITCKRCGKPGLKWERLSGRYSKHGERWRLLEADGVLYHACFTDAAGADEFEIITENKLKAKTKTSRAKKVSKGYSTIGVRFLNGSNTSLHKVYTYKIRKGAKVHLGQLLIANYSLAAIVEIHPTPQDTVVGMDYKFITQKVAAL